VGTDWKLYCKECNEKIWIGQSLGENHTLYKDEHENLDKFLWKHRIHNLKYDTEESSFVGKCKDYESEVRENMGTIKKKKSETTNESRK